MKVIPKGVESTMQTFTGVIHGLNMHMVRAQIGILINNKFVHVTKENVGSYPTLTIIELVCAFIPFVYIKCLIPTIDSVEEAHHEIVGCDCPEDLIKKAKCKFEKSKFEPGSWINSAIVMQVAE